MRQLKRRLDPSTDVTREGPQLTLKLSGYNHEAAAGRVETSLSHTGAGFKDGKLRLSFLGVFCFEQDLKRLLFSCFSFVFPRYPDVLPKLQSGPNQPLPAGWFQTSFLYEG